MTKLPSVTGKEVVTALTNAGFEVVRQRGSHVFMRHADGRATVVPVHAGESIGPGLLSRILIDTDISRAEFVGLP